MSPTKSAERISKILGPHLWMPVIIVLLLFRTGLSSDQLAVLVPSLITLLLIIPFAYLHIALKMGLISKWDIPKMEERRTIIVIFVVCSLVSLILVKHLGTKMLLDLFILLLATGFITALITVYWKISIHMVLDTTGILITNLILGWHFWPLFILIPIVAWARLRLRRHTPAQILAGILLSIIIFTVGIEFFNL